MHWRWRVRNLDSKRVHREGGFSVVEVAMATAFLAVAALVAFPTMISFFELSRTAQDENIALFDLESALEDLRSARLDPEKAQENFLKYTQFVPDPQGDWIWHAGNGEWVFVGLGQGTHLPLFPKYTMYVPTIDDPDWLYNQDMENWIQVEPGQGTHRRNLSVHLEEQQMVVRYMDPSVEPLTATVTIRWKDHDGRDNQESLTTAIAR